MINEILANPSLGKPVHLSILYDATDPNHASETDAIIKTCEDAVYHHGVRIMVRTYKSGKELVFNPYTDGPEAVTYRETWKGVQDVLIKPFRKEDYGRDFDQAHHSDVLHHSDDCSPSNGEDFGNWLDRNFDSSSVNGLLLFGHGSPQSIARMTFEDCGNGLRAASKRIGKKIDYFIAHSCLVATKNNFRSLEESTKVAALCADVTRGSDVSLFAKDIVEVLQTTAHLLPAQANALFSTRVRRIFQENRFLIDDEIQQGFAPKSMVCVDLDKFSQVVSTWELLEKAIHTLPQKTQQDIYNRVHLNSVSDLPEASQHGQADIMRLANAVIFASFDPTAESAAKALKNSLTEATLAKIGPLAEISFQLSELFPGMWNTEAEKIRKLFDF